MKRTATASATVTSIEPNPFFSVVADCEEDMRNVQHLAHILYEFLSDRGRISPATQSALCLVAGELLAMGYALDEKCDALYEVARKHH